MLKPMEEIASVFRVENTYTLFIYYIYIYIHIHQIIFLSEYKYK
ncbi:hypothetical protein F975_00032 [Acinetobacter sp. ANC 3789]|nr:hypothetical protein F975_00032 [Acinetobacter sp. ANC 3789]